MSDESTAERLLQLACRRPAAPPERAASVRAAVRDAWRLDLRRRRARRLAVRSAAVMTAAAGLVWAATLWRPASPNPAPVVAAIERWERAGAVAAGAWVRAGEWMTTEDTARLTLRTPSGSSIRIDERTRARFASETALELASGAVYLDTAPGAAAIAIRTPLATVTHVGTQFEVRVLDDRVRVRVRTGAVTVRRGAEAQSIRVEARTELVMSPTDAASRAIPPFGDDWQWAARMAPPFRAEGARLAAFLAHLARENGWTVRYEDAALERAAGGVRLHGSLEHLDPTDALEVALTIADLAYTLDSGQLSVFRRRR
jgi:ferric-dicitrate binding protein FerR (iron transport regulator)